MDAQSKQEVGDGNLSFAWLDSVSGLSFVDTQQSECESLNKPTTFSGTQQRSEQSVLTLEGRPTGSDIVRGGMSASKVAHKYNILCSMGDLRDLPR